jgi:predicted transport protein
VISLFNGFIPLVAIQMQAYRVGDQVSLLFTTVLDQMKLGLVDEDEEVAEAADRSYWEQRGSKVTLEMTDKLHAIIRTLDPELSLKYNKFYIGLAKNDQPNNFAIFRPKKDWVRLEFRLERSDEMQAKLEQAGLDVMDYDDHWGRYRVRLTKGDIEKYQDLLKELLQKSYAESGQ